MDTGHVVEVEPVGAKPELRMQLTAYLDDVEAASWEITSFEVAAAIARHYPSKVVADIVGGLHQYKVCVLPGSFVMEDLVFLGYQSPSVT